MSTLLNKTSQLLINEPPLQVQPSLAVKIGDLDEAIIIQQIHYWLQRSKSVKEGHTWIFNTYESWHEQFPFWSVSKIRSKFRSLEKKGYLITGNFNKMKVDHTKWYRINYKKLNEALHDKPADLNTSSAKTANSAVKINNSSANSDRRYVQNKQTNRQDLTQRCADFKHTNNHRLPETTTENNIYIRRSPTNDPTPNQKQDDPVKQVIDYLNQETGRTTKRDQFSYKTKQYKTLINARFKDGYTLSDFKRVIDNKCAEWLHDPEMVNYLRPSTLFRPANFDQYLKQKNAKPRIRSQGKVVEQGTDWSKKKAKTSGNIMSDAEMDAIFNSFGGADSDNS